MNLFDQNDFQNSTNNVISNLVSELFNHINSKESFSYISDLLITSLSKYKRKIPIETQTENIENNFVKIEKNDYNNIEYKINDSINEYLSISNDIHLILSNCQDLTNIQKLDFCNTQRYFMKLYLKELLQKINKA